MVTLPPRSQRQKPYIIHVDSVVLKSNRETGRLDPIVRVITPGPRKYLAKMVYGDWVQIFGPSWLDTQWDNPLPDRPMAICVLRTYASIRVGSQSESLPDGVVCRL